MSKDHYQTGPKTKQCECGRTFSRPHNMLSENWEKADQCPYCRPYRAGAKLPHPSLGHYEVKHPVIDAFLQGKAT